MFEDAFCENIEKLGFDLPDQLASTVLFSVASVDRGVLQQGLVLSPLELEEGIEVYRSCLAFRPCRRVPAVC